jgi:V8-like Glu-specific endopeptidase
MRVQRALVLILFLATGLAGAAPHAAVAQDVPAPGATGSAVGDAGNSMLYLPVLRTGAGDEGTPREIVTAAVSPEEQAAVEVLWTRQMMLGAESLDLLVMDEYTQTAVPQVEDVPPGPRGAVPGTLPDRQAARLAARLYAPEWARMAADDAALDAAGDAAGTRLAVPGLRGAAGEETDRYASAPPFASYYVNDSAATWKSFPWTAMGRLFFQIPGLAGTYACSGAAGSGRAVWTAGHCVYTPGRGWSYNMYFVPAYRNGNYPYGAFTVKSRTVLREWLEAGNLAYDIGMVAVNDRSGMKLSQWVGNLGFMWNHSAVQMFHAFGYPSNYSSGQYLVTCAASTYERDPLVGPDPIGVGCDMSSGASGGPWLVGYAPFKGGLTNYINGLVSYSYATKPLEVFGPYFGDGAKELYDWGKEQ